MDGKGDTLGDATDNGRYKLHRNGNNLLSAKWDAKVRRCQQGFDGCDLLNLGFSVTFTVDRFFVLLLV